MAFEAMPPAGTRVLITGAAGGLGRAMAARFAAAGCRLLLADRSSDALEDLSVDLGDAVEGAAVYDQGDAASIEAMVACLPAPDVLVNNAGILRAGAILDMDPASIEEIIRVNLTGPLLIARLAAPRMIEAGGGVIVNISSQLAFDGAATRGVYAAAKAGLSQFTRSAAAEWMGSGLRVCALAPGRTLTPMIEGLVADPGVRAAALKGIPAGRFGDPDEMATLACFLASPAASYIVGETLIADGGFVLTAGRPAP